MAARVEQLLDANAEPGAELWRARDFARVVAGQRSSGIATGFADLDAALFERGWPRAGLMELLSDAAGLGELRLLTPALVMLSATENRWIAWVDPPFVPYAPALEAAGIDLGKLLLIRPEGEREAVWALEQALKTGACSAALGWLPEAGLDFSTLRRLAIAARQGGAWATLFRPAHAARRASGAELRLRLSPLPPLPPLPSERLHVEIVKRPGGWPLAGIEVGFAEPSDAAMLAREEPTPAQAACGGASE